MIKSLFGIRQIYTILMNLIPVALYYISSGLLHFVSARYPKDETVMEGNNEVQFLFTSLKLHLVTVWEKYHFIISLFIWINELVCIFVNSEGLMED